MNTTVHLKASEGFRDEALEDSSPEETLETSGIKAVHVQYSDCESAKAIFAIRPRNMLVETSCLFVLQCRLKYMEQSLLANED